MTSLARRIGNTARLVARGRLERRVPYWSLQRVERLQRRRLRSIVGHAYRTVPFYRESMRKLGLEPEGLDSAADLARLPLIDAVGVRNDLRAFLSSDVREDQRVAMKSSGSAHGGVRTVVWWDGRSQLAKLAIAERDRAVIVRELGRGWGVRQLFVLPETSVSLELRAWWDARTLAPRGVAERHVILADRPFVEVADRIDAVRPDVVYSYGSFADRFFRHLASVERPLTHPRVWVYGGDMLPPDGRERIEREFGVAVFSTYQAIETGRLGFECEARRGFHLNVDLCAVRLVDARGEDVAPGEPGEVVVSNLYNRAMVLLNYRLGDRGVMATEPCRCGRGLPRLERLEGRVSEVVRLADGREISSMILRNLLKDELAFALQCQLVRPATDLVAWRIVPLPGVDREAAGRALVRKSARLLGESSRVTVEFLAELPISPGGKHSIIGPSEPPAA